MGNISAISIIDRSETTLQDTTNTRWPFQELLNYLNDGQREIVLQKPEAYVKNELALLTPGAAKQSIPTSGIVLLDVTRNMGTASNESTPGRAIRIASKEILDAQIPDWSYATNSLGYIQHYMFDPRDPKHYYVYPKAPGSAHYVEMIFSAAPTDVQLLSVTTAVNDTITTSGAHGLVVGQTVRFESLVNIAYGVTTGTTYYIASVPTTTTFTLSATQGGSVIDITGVTTGTMYATISIDDIYANALNDYILYRAYSKDATYAQNGQLAVAHYSALANSLGIKTQNELTRNPNMQQMPFNPNVPGAAR